MAKKSAKNKTVLPDPLPKGEILTDIAKKKWILGPSIGVGGFGEIYSAAASDGIKKDYQYVIKIEPHGNGPLFCEMHFFMRNCKPDMIQAWCSQKKMKSLGMPKYLGSGSHDHKGKKYRFLVMDKYGKDLWCIFLENNRKFPSATVYRIAIQLLDVLEYIHNNGYIHADIKGANILTGLTKATEEQVYLVDFGLASHYTTREYKPDPKKAHNGTIEYTSRDAHEGVATRRGDLEILAYNMIQWMGCKLPWEKNLTDPVAVHKSKKINMEDIMGFTKLCFGNYTSVPAALIEFLDYIKKMQYNGEPNYKLIRNLFVTGLESSGGSTTGSLKFKVIKSTEPTGATPKKQAKLELEPIVIQKRRGRPQKNTVTPNKKTNLENDDDDDDAPLQPKHQNAEMMRLQKKIADRKTGKTTQVVTGAENDQDDSNIPLQQRCNAEMMRIQKKIADRKTGKTKRVASGTNVEMVTMKDNHDDVIDDTPPQKLNAKKRVNKDQLSLQTDKKIISPTTGMKRTLRQRTMRSYTDGDDSE